VINIQGTAILAAIVIGITVQASPAGEMKTGSSVIKHRFLVHDEGNAGLAYIDEYDPAKNWKYSNGGQTYWGLQLVGNNRVLLGTSNEVDIKTGKEAKPRVATGGNPSAIRLENGNTLRCYESGSRVIEEVDSTGKQLRKKVFTGMSVLRMATYTPAQTFLFASNHSVDEVDWNGNIVWHFGDPDSAKTGSNQHICRALRMPNGNTIISTGYGARLIVVSKDKKVLKVIGGKNQPGNDSIKSNYYAGFHVLPNGHYVLTNWQAHGPNHGGEGVQILEYDSSGVLVWSYKNPSMYSSVQDIIILDSLDISKFHDERTGVVAPVVVTRTMDSYRFYGSAGPGISMMNNGGNEVSLYTVNGKLIGQREYAGIRQSGYNRVLVAKRDRSSTVLILNNWMGLE
jgi:hypothetical protein